MKCTPFIRAFESPLAPSSRRSKGTKATPCSPHHRRIAALRRGTPALKARSSSEPLRLPLSAVVRGGGRREATRGRGEGVEDQDDQRQELTSIAHQKQSAGRSQQQQQR